MSSDGASAREALVERGTGHLIVKLPAQRVSELAAAGQALPFAPNGRTFREWAAFPVADPAEWRALLAEARGFSQCSGPLEATTEPASRPATEARSHPDREDPAPFG